MTKRAAIYGRVSTKDQTTDNQMRELREIAERAGWEVVDEFVDHGVSGAKGRDKRPQFDALCKAVVRREVDVVMSWSVDRLGRSLQHLVAFLADLEGAGVDLFLSQQGVDTTTPGGKALFQMMGVFAEFERSMIKERVQSGIERARQEEAHPQGVKRRKRMGGHRSLATNFLKRLVGPGAKVFHIALLRSERVYRLEQCKTHLNSWRLPDDSDQ